MLHSIMVPYPLCLNVGSSIRVQPRPTRTRTGIDPRCASKPGLGQTNNPISRNVYNARNKYQTTYKRIEQLKRYRDLHGHALVPYKEPSGLGRWIAEQRYRYQKGLVDVEIYRQLSAAGVPLRAQEARWDVRFKQLVEFVDQHGHARVHRSDDVPNGLYSWVLQQRQMMKQGRLSEFRKGKLDALGFVWDMQEYTWRKNMDDLKTFYQEHGHCRVVRGWEKSPTLYCWMRRIQNSSKNGFSDVPCAMQEDIENLYAWGAVKRYRQPWELRYQELCQIREECQKSGMLQYNRLKEKGLVAWCRSQRFAYRQGSLAADRYICLERIGFDWDRGDLRWIMNKIYY